MPIKSVKNSKIMNNNKNGILPDKIDRFEVRIAGAGGQGIISMGMLLAKAISLGDKKNASQSQSYGPEARGGATLADVIISDKTIYFPECITPDILIALTPGAYEYYAASVKPNGIIIADSNAVETVVGSVMTVEVPILKTCLEKFLNPIVANMVTLGFLTEFTGIVSKKSIKSAVEDRFEKSKFLETNLKALKAGFELGKKFKSEGLTQIEPGICLNL